MDKENGKSPLVAISTLVALFTALGVMVYTQVPLKGIRPSVPEIYEPSQRIRARLWEDPFLAVMTQAKAKDRAQPVPAGRIFLMEPEKKICDPMAKEINERLGKEKVTILGVMVFGGPYEEDMEHRLRQRYAVLSALGRIGFTPEDSDHIRFLRVFQNKMAERLEPQISLFTLMPFEWLVSDTGRESVLLLWINEYALYQKPLFNLDSLIASLRPNDIPKDKDRNLSFKIVGPAGSTTLLAMIKEKTELENQKGEAAAVDGFHYSKQLSKLKIFSHSATAADQILLQEVQNKNGGVQPQFIKERLNTGKITIEFSRTICADDSLCNILLDELELRGVGPKDYIVLLAEWDTFYGRKFPETFRKIREKRDGVGRLLRYSYLRGIDGKLPGEADLNAGKDRKNGGDRKQREDRQKGEEPEGKNQYDYLRRLAEAICGVERKLTLTHGGEIKAIGVLGSDFHDKYLVLQALGQRFPEKIFFTTDLDARLLHPANIQWTRNLLVASGFGLQLRKDLQCDTPPFRDSYQASVFLATLGAFDDQKFFLMDDEPWDSPDPCIFEIGRHHAIDLTPRNEYYIPINQALPTANYPRLNRTWLIWLLLLLITLATLLLISCAVAKTNLTDLVKAGWQFIKKNKIPVLLGLGGLLSLSLLILFLFKELQKPTEEHFFLTEGISAWPAEIIRLVAFGCSWIFFFITWFRLKRNQDQLTQEFQFGENKEEPLSDDQAGYLNLDNAWKDYVVRGGWWRRFSRFFPVMFIYGIFCIVVVKTFGVPSRPLRGVTTGKLDLIILFCTIFSFLFLTFFILDATMTCRGFVTRFLRKEAKWSPESMEAFKGKIGTAEYEEGLSEWLLIRLIASSTAVVGKLIFFPFIVWFILFLARLSYFDKWPTPIGLVIVISMIALLTWGCAVMLRRSAEKLRADVVDRLSKKLIRAQWKKPPDKKPIERLKYVLDEVKSAHTGAFAPYLQQPVLQALVVPFGGVGMVQLIEFLSNLN
jgi:hypothetical protein